MRATDCAHSRRHSCDRAWIGRRGRGPSAVRVFQVVIDDFSLFLPALKCLGRKGLLPTSTIETQIHSLIRNKPPAIRSPIVAPYLRIEKCRGRVQVVFLANCSMNAMALCNQCRLIDGTAACKMSKIHSSSLAVIWNHLWHSNASTAVDLATTNIEYKPTK